MTDPDAFISVGLPSYLKRLTRIGTGIYADSVVNAAASIDPEVVVAGAASTLGKIGTVAQNVPLYVRCDCTDKPWTAVKWRINSDKACTYQFMTAIPAAGVFARAESVTVTLASIANTETGVINALTFTAVDAAASVDYAAHNFYTGGADATADAASLRKAINGGTKITLASVAAGEKIVVAGFTYTAHATTTTPANREFAINGTDAQDATALASCINDGTYGSGLAIACEANGATVSFEGTTACTGSAGATVAQWTGVPGVTATIALGVVTIVPTTATVIQAVTGTAAGHWAVASTTLTKLTWDGAVVTLAANSTTAGATVLQYIDGHPYPYLCVIPTEAAAATIAVGATRIP